MAQESSILIEVSQDNATWAQLVSLPAGSTSHSHTGLTAGTLRYYRIKAVGDGVNTLDSPYAVANATTASATNTTPVAPTVTADDTANWVDFAHALGDAEIIVSENGGAYVAMTTLAGWDATNGRINVGDVARAIGYFKAKTRAVTGRNESPVTDSPAFTSSVVNAAPTANAGADQSLASGTTTATLTGSGTDSDGTIASYAWSVITGTATITTPTAASTGVTGLVAGANTFRLTVTDNGGLTATDDVTITVQSPIFHSEFTGTAGTTAFSNAPKIGTWLENTVAGWEIATSYTNDAGTVVTGDFGINTVAGALIKTQSVTGDLKIYADIFLPLPPAGTANRFQIRGRTSANSHVEATIDRTSDGATTFFLYDKREGSFVEIAAGSKIGPAKGQLRLYLSFAANFATARVTDEAPGSTPNPTHPGYNDFIDGTTLVADGGSAAIFGGVGLGSAPGTGIAVYDLIIVR